MSLNFNFKIEKKDLWLLAAIFVFLAGVTYVIALNSGNYLIHGHDAGEIDIPTMKFCNSVDTYNGLGSAGDTWNGYGTISLLIDGRNICEDDNGCTYRIWRKTINLPAGVDFYLTNPVMFRQVECCGSLGGIWHDASGNNIGTNGETTETPLFTDWGGLYMWDDKNNPIVENSPDLLTWRDNSASSFLITFCDY